MRRVCASLTVLTEYFLQYLNHELPQRTYYQSGDPQMVGSVASPQMPDRELNLSVGALPPIFNDWNETALWNLSYNFAGFATSCINRQRKYL
jgi:hypothetical protein